MSTKALAGLSHSFTPWKELQTIVSWGRALSRLQSQQSLDYKNLDSKLLGWRSHSSDAQARKGLLHFCVVGSGPAGFYTVSQVPYYVHTVRLLWMKRYLNPVYMVCSWWHQKWCIRIATLRRDAHQNGTLAVVCLLSPYCIHLVLCLKFDNDQYRHSRLWVRFHVLPDNLHVWGFICLAQKSVFCRCAASSELRPCNEHSMEMWQPSCTMSPYSGHIQLQTMLPDLINCVSGSYLLSMSWKERLLGPQQIDT